MSGKRQKNQLELAFLAESRSEAPRAATEGTETLAAKRDTESPARTDRLMEAVVERENCKEALKRVKSNQGSAGIDGMTVAVQQVLQRRWNGTFSDSSFGFRPNRSAHQAVARAQQYMAQGYGTVVDFDLEKLFDRVNQDKLMGRIAQRVEDKRLLKLIRAFLRAGVMEDGLVSPSVEGTPQGGRLSAAGRRVDPLSARLARLLRLPRNPLGAAGTGLVGAAALALCVLDSVEDGSQAV